jgi:hypothetical protein
LVYSALKNIPKNTRYFCGQPALNRQFLSSKSQAFDGEQNPLREIYGQNEPGFGKICSRQKFSQEGQIGRPLQFKLEVKAKMAR